MKEKTNLVKKGNKPSENHGIINPPLYRASTILYPDVESFKTRKNVTYSYGLSGTPTTTALEEALTSLEQGVDTILLSSGLQALYVAIISLAKAGQHILVPDNVYWPLRDVCDFLKANMDIETSYYAADIGAEIEKLFRKETAILLLESPGSITLEMTDIPALAEMARKNGIATVCDNTWATGYYFKPLTLGIDLSLMATTKYIAGHADLMMGHIVAGNEEVAQKIRDVRSIMGFGVGPDDCWLALRGMRSLAARLAAHQKAGFEIAHMLEGHPSVHRVLFPGLESHPDHSLWKRDFTGAASLFAFTLKDATPASIEAFVNPMQLFKIGSSWGGCDSLIVPFDVNKNRTVTSWPEDEQLIRIHVGLEDVEDLKEDLRAGLERYLQALK